MTTAGLILAAGRSTRFGSEDKLLHPLSGRPLAAHIAFAMRAVRLDLRIAVVTNPAVGRVFHGYDVIETGGGGQADSLRAGIHHARAMGADRVLIALADMPMVTSDLLTAVLDRCRSDQPSVATDGARRSPPACFPAAQFEALMTLNGDRGAGALIRDLPSESLVPTQPDCLWDVDTQSDLDAVAARLGAGV